MHFSINAHAVQGFSLKQVRACLRLEPLSLKLNGSRCDLLYASPYGLPCGLLHGLLLLCRGAAARARACAAARVVHGWTRAPPDVFDVQSAGRETRLERQSQREREERGMYVSLVASYAACSILLAVCVGVL